MNSLWNMKRGGLVMLVVALITISAAAFAQQAFRVYDSFEGDDSTDDLPADYKVPGEFVVGRLMYPSRMRLGFSRGGDWRSGGTSWAVDYPKGDRTFARLLRRLTRVNARSVEQPVNPDDGDDIYHWPFLIVGLAGYWELTDQHCTMLREYLLRGGFLFADSFFGSDSWIGFEEGMKCIFPDRHIVDLTDDHPVFHAVYDLKNMTKTQIPNMNSLMRGGAGWFSDGAVPHWRGISDDNGRLMVLIAFNNDVSDSWQWADDERYPADLANLGLRIGVNIAAYSMSH
jgi:hypothetical protein